MSSSEQSVEVKPLSGARRLLAWNPSRRESFVLLGVASFLIIVFLGLALGYWGVQRGRIYNGVSVRGVSLGHMTEQEARPVVAQAAAAFLARPVDLAVQGTVWHPTPSQLGVRVDTEQTLQAALAVGRGDSFFANVGQVINAARRGSDVGLIVHYDDNAVRQYLQQLASQVHRDPVSGTIRLEGSKVIVQPGVPGRDLDVETSVGVVARSLASPAGQNVELPALALPTSLADSRLRQLEKQVNSMLSGPQTLLWEQEKWQLSTEQVANAISFNETKDGVGATTDMTLVVAEEKIIPYLESIAPQVGNQGRDASVQLTENGPEAVAGQPGVALDVAGSAKQVKGDLLGGRRETSLVTVPTTPSISDEQADKAAAEARTLLGAPLLLSFEDKKWEIAPDALRAMLGFERVDDAEHQAALRPQLDPAKLRAFLEGIAPEVRQEPVNGRLDWNGGNLRMLAPGKDGRALDVEATVSSVNSGLPEGRQAFLIQTTPVRPSVREDNLKTLGIVELVAKGTSNYRGSASDRAHNIQTAVGYLNGAVVAPGAEFSFLGTLGPITKERGYVDGLTIVADQTIPGVGGGVCQVSTTVFRAAFWSGMPITERSEHTYRVGYYEQGGDPVGFDAAIWEPSPDLKFRNETSSYLLVQAATDNGILTVSLYGTRPTGEVSMQGPFISNRVPAPPTKYVDDPSLKPGEEKKVDSAHEGLDVLIVRVIKQNGQVVREDKFASHFRAWPAVVHRAPQPDQPGEAPAPGSQELQEIAPRPGEEVAAPGGQPQPASTQPGQLL